MDADRLFTVACAERDFRASSSASVFDAFGKEDIVAAFRDRPLDAELAQHNLLHRIAEWRDLGEPGAPPGSAQIGKLTTEGRRAYLWRDDGSAYDEPIGGEVVWCFGCGQRFGDSKHRDYHKTTGRKLMLDPTDSWKPTREQDYPALFELRAQGDFEADLQAVSRARDLARSNPKSVIPIKLKRLEAKIGEAHDEILAAGAIIDDLHFRYFVISRFYVETREPLVKEVALIYAEEAFTDLKRWGAVWANEIMLEGLDALNDAACYCYAADLADQA